MSANYRDDDDDFRKQEGDDDGETCCCGCSLDCAITTFGVISIITFIIAIIAFILSCFIGATIASKGIKALTDSLEAAKATGNQTAIDNAELALSQAQETLNSTGYSEKQLGAGIVVFSLLMVIPAAAPGYLYIRYFCDKENNDRL